MSKQKRFEKREDILRDIASHQTKFTHHMVEAERLDQQSTQCFKDGNDFLGRVRKEEAKKQRRTAYLIENVHLPRLKHTLASFDTELLPGVIDDRAVVLAKE